MRGARCHVALSVGPRPSGVFAMHLPWTMQGSTRTDLDCAPNCGWPWHSLWSRQTTGMPSMTL